MFNRFSDRSRAQKMKLFYQYMKPTASDRVLDVGGECAPGHKDHQLYDDYPWKRSLTVLNLDSHILNILTRAYPDSAPVAGDATCLPFPDKSFDIAFSNAVIEHLFTWENQQKMAREIQRVAKRWFVVTPNRWYPFEFHARVPLITWLPNSWMRCVASRICWNHIERRYMSGLGVWSVQLLSRRQMQHLFPDSQIIPLRVTFQAETLLAVGPVEKQ